MLSLKVCLAVLFYATAISAAKINLQPLLPPQNPFRHPYQNLKHSAEVSLNRARHLRNPKPHRSTTATTATPLFSHSYGGYSISLGFGSPPQSLSFIMDTGSSFVWFPCTSRYICSNCSSSNIETFKPKRSSSFKLVGCQNPKCAWIHKTDLRCATCRNCSRICPPYLIQYGLGSTGGLAISETLRLPNLSARNFLAGCSLTSYRQPAGIAGFGRGLSSLPSQLRLAKFSYCLISRQFDDTVKSSSLFLYSRSHSNNGTSGLRFTKFVRNPVVKDHPAFSVYYYIGLRGITVGDQRIRIPRGSLSVGSEGNGGTIIDSGTTFTFMSPEVFRPMSNEILRQMKRYDRVFDVEKVTGLQPCFNISGHERAEFPKLRFHFNGGTVMRLPAENYFALVKEDGVACLTMMTEVEGLQKLGGPDVILGNFQTQNFYMEYDLKDGRLGFRQKKCG